MKNGKNPDPNVIHPVAGYDKEIYVKPTITNPNIIVGGFTYIADSEFESHVTNFYPWSRDESIDRMDILLISTHCSFSFIVLCSPVQGNPSLVSPVN